jgi:thiol-disulfide isomerase/thioredoxin
MIKKIGWMITVLAAACLLAAVVIGAAEQPLTKDDVTLLLLGGSSSEKVAALAQERGVDFRMTPDLAKRFRDLGASEGLIEALQKAGENPRTSTPATTAPAPTVPAAPPPQLPPPSEPSRASQPQDVEQKISETLAALSSAPSAANPDDFPLAPPFTLVALGGQKIDLDSLTGKVVLLDFWATWCSPCRTEIPEFARLQNEYYIRGFRVIGVAVGEQKEAVQKFYHQYNMNYPVAMVTPEVRKLYGGLHSLPTTLLIGRDGRIYAKAEGAPADLEMFERRIKSLLAVSENRQTASALQGGAGTAGPTSGSAGAQQAPASTPPAAQAPGASASKPAPTPAPVASSRQVSAGTQPPSAPVSNPASPPTLSAPGPEEVQRIIQEFATKEKLFKLARDNYTYHQINKVQELDSDNEVVGVYQQEWDIVYDDAGNRLERVTYAPDTTLKDIMITREDLDAMRNIQPFVMTVDDLPDYDVKYLGHVKVDEITAYVFSIRPKEIKKGRQYFQGIIWVDDRDLQIVKSEGKQVPELRTKKGEENLFPRFTTYREQIDGKYWFPTFTMADDTLYFSGGPVHVKEIIRYTSYKQFKAGVRILSVEALDKPKDKDQTKTTPAQPPPKP